MKKIARLSSSDSNRVPQKFESDELAQIVPTRQLRYAYSNQSLWGGVRLSPLGTSAINWPIVPASNDR
jgi:hypothetical protein